MNEDLCNLVEYSHLRHGILFSAIVMNTPDIATGKMELATLKRFIAAARLLDYPITDEEAFLREQQARVFAGAQREPSSNLWQ
jgi:hypothetical protein